MDKKVKVVQPRAVAEKVLEEDYEKDMSRSAIGRLRELFDSIQQKREGGMSLDKILESLKKVGLDLHPSTFRSYLHIIRKERGIEKVAPAERPAKQKKPAKPTHPKGCDLRGEKAGVGQGVAKVKEVAANMVILSGREVAVNADGELIRPDGMPNPAWADLQAEYRAVQRKLNRNK